MHMHKEGYRSDKKISAFEKARGVFYSFLAHSSQHFREKTFKMLKHSEFSINDPSVT